MKKFEFLKDGLSFTYGCKKYTMTSEPQVEEINGKICFVAIAKNQNNEEVKIIWDALKNWVDSDQEDCGNACNWDEPSSVESL